MADAQTRPPLARSACLAAGHVAFGAFGRVQARYRRIDALDIDRADQAVARAVRALTSPSR